MFANVAAVLIDVDGTLIDSNDAHAKCWVEVLSRHGHDVAFERIRPLIGKGGDKLLQEVAGLDDETGEGKAIAEERRDLFKASHLHGLKPTCGARPLLEHLRARGVAIVVATSAGGDELSDLLRQAGVEDLVDAASSSRDVEQSKPDPDVVEVALRKAGVPADRALMIGDTPYDIDAATRSDVATVALRCGGWWDDAALSGAAGLYDDPAALLAAWAGH